MRPTSHIALTAHSKSSIRAANRLAEPYVRMIYTPGLAVVGRMPKLGKSEITPMAHCRRPRY